MNVVRNAQGTNPGAPAPTNAPPLLRRTQLLERVRNARPSLVFLTASAGYGKTTVARQIAQQRPRWAIVDCAGVVTESDLLRKTVAALVQEQPARESALTSLRLVREDQLPASMYEILDAWAQPVDDSVIVFDNVEALEGSERCQVLLRRLLSTRPRGRQVVICSRTSMRARVSRLAPPNEVLTLTNDDLAFSREEFQSLFADADPVREDIQAAYGVARGWPIATLLLARFARDGRLDPLLVHLHDVAFDDLYDYLATEVLDALDANARRALEAAARIPDATSDDIQLALGAKGSSEDAARRLADLPFVARRIDGTYEVHPFMRAMLDHRGAPPEQVLARVALGHEAARQFVRAAQLHALNGKKLETARLLSLELDASGQGRAPSAISACVAQLLATLDMDAFIQYPQLWYLATHAERFRRDYAAVLHEAQTLMREADARNYPLSVRAALVTRIAVALNGEGRPEEALSLVYAFQAQAAAAGHELQAALLAARANPLIRLGRLGEAQRCLDEARALVPSGDYFTTNSILSDAALVKRMRGERAEERLLLRSGTESARRANLPSLVAAALAMEVFGAWLAGEDSLYAMLAAELDSLVAKNALRGLEHVSACANGRIRASPCGIELPVTLNSAYLYAAAASRSDSDRINFVDAAMEAAVASSNDFGQVITGIAIALVDPHRSAEVLASARKLARRIESEPLNWAVNSICAGGRDAGMLNAFVRRFTREGPLSGAAARTFSILSGTFRDAGVESTLAGREYDVLLALARSPRGVARERLVATVWPDEDSERGRKALNSTMRRLRARVGQDVIAYDEDVYRIAGDVAVDTWAIEQTWRQLRGAKRLEPSQRRQLLGLVERLRAYRESGPRPPEWFESQARQLNELAEEITVKLARDHLMAGEPREAATLARGIIAFDDLDETAWEILIRALIADNDRPGAARELRRYCKVLRAELGAEPPAELLRLIS
jgi:DNA-binding SARP family transcriptional activator